MGKRVIYEFYDILGCNRGCSQEELKRAYKKMALIYHPDKNTDNDTKRNEKFLLLEEAWRTLSDPELRQQYDADCRQARLEYENLIIHERIHLNDMVKVDGIFSYPCRCGGQYFLEENEFDCGQIYISCQDCTFAIAVKK